MGVLGAWHSGAGTVRLSLSCPSARGPDHPSRLISHAQWIGAITDVKYEGTALGVSAIFYQREGLAVHLSWSGSRRLAFRCRYGSSQPILPICPGSGPSLPPDLARAMDWRNRRRQV